MKTRLLTVVLAASFLAASFARGQSATNTPTPQRTPTPTPTSNRVSDFSLDKAASAESVDPGQNLTYTLTVRNLGPSANVTGFRIDDTLPSDVSFVSASLPSGSCFRSGATVTCSTGSALGVGGVVSATIVVTTAKPGPITNTATVSQNGGISGFPFDPNLANNTAAVTTTVLGAPAVALYLHGSGAAVNPPVLFLDGAAPTLATPKSKDSGVVRAGLTNPWVEVGTWTAEPDLVAGSLAELGDLHVWLGLTNSDDTGTQFALRGEVWKNGVELVAAGETACVAGLVRNPASAKEAKVPLHVFTPVAFDGATDVLSLKVLARIGTGCPGPGHASATGLRLYFDGARTPSGF